MMEASMGDEMFLVVTPTDRELFSGKIQAGDWALDVVFGGLRPLGRGV